MFQQLKSARGDRSQHFANLNHYQAEGVRAHTMEGKFWQIDEDIFDEFLNVLPPNYVSGGFRMIEKLTYDLAATYLKVGDTFWCGYCNRSEVLELDEAIRAEVFP